MNTIVIGGGQAGITLSYFLQQREVKHLVLERDWVFSAWYNLDEHTGWRAKTICTEHAARPFVPDATKKLLQTIQLH